MNRRFFRASATAALVAVLFFAHLGTCAAASPEAERLSIGDRLPELRGDYLSERKALLPDDATGRVALLMLGFTYKSRFAVEDWGKRFRAEFQKNPQITFYEIPMISGLGRAAKWFIESGMRRGTPKADHQNVITVYGGAEPWKQRLQVTTETDAYLILLDAKGNIAWLHSGTVDDASYHELSGQARKLIAVP